MARRPIPLGGLGVGGQSPFQMAPGPAAPQRPATPLLGGGQMSGGNPGEARMAPPALPTGALGAASAPPMEPNTSDTPMGGLQPPMQGLPSTPLTGQEFTPSYGQQTPPWKGPTQGDIPRVNVPSNAPPRQMPAALPGNGPNWSPQDLGAGPNPPQPLVGGDKIGSPMGPAMPIAGDPAFADILRNLFSGGM